MLFEADALGIQIKSAASLRAMRKAGRAAAITLEELIACVRPGVTTEDLDVRARELARRFDARMAPLNYKGFPKAICTSVNAVICHGIPSPEVVLQEGDIVGIDVTLVVDGYHGDTAATVPVGAIGADARRLIDVSLEALRRGVAAVSPTRTLGDVGHAIQTYAEGQGYGVVRDFVGHGTGRRFHEPPQVPHYGRPGEGVRLVPGMTFTVEPMINEGTWRHHLERDGWTATTLDGRLSSQFEHTLAVTPDGVEILTRQGAGSVWEPPGRFAWSGGPAL